MQAKVFFAVFAFAIAATVALAYPAEPLDDVNVNDYDAQRAKNSSQLNNSKDNSYNIINPSQFFCSTIDHIETNHN
jgi:hypothetical protein